MAAGNLRSFQAAKLSENFGLQRIADLRSAEHSTKYESTKTFAHALAQLLEHDHREMVVSDMKKKRSNRKGFCRLEPE